MITRKIQLFPDRPWVTLEYFGNELAGAPRDAMLVIPGGGYWCVCSDREGYPIALSYYMQGMQSFVLTYSTHEHGRITHPTQPLEEAAAAMLYIREHAEEFGVSGKVYASGFSAGGHLAGSLATLWNSEAIKNAFSGKERLVRPDGVVLCYAVISEYPEKVPETSFNCLYGGKEELTEEEKRAFRLECHVDADSSPAFIVHTFDDQRVPVENALAMAGAYTKAGVPFEMHIYPHSQHGMALANDVTWCGVEEFNDPQMARWVADSRYWMKKHT